MQSLIQKVDLFNKLATIKTDKWNNYVIHEEVSFDPGDRIIISKNEKIDFNNVGAGDQPTWRKPKGLWYGLGRSWLDWVGDNYKYNPEFYGKHLFKISVNDGVIYKIDDQKSYDDFTKKYGNKESSDIYWGKVAQDYAGIEFINPRDYGHMFGWASIWDVDSGCIWNSSAVGNIEKIA